MFNHKRVHVPDLPDAHTQNKHGKHTQTARADWLRSNVTNLSDLLHELVLVEAHIAVILVAVHAANDARRPVQQRRDERVLRMSQM